MARQILGKVVPTGEDTYDNNKTYDELCIVMYNGQSYISKKETRGNKPDNTEYWQQLVEKPVKGTDYFTEADKDEIVNDVTNDATNKYNQAVTTGMEKFDQNAERKTSDFNDNASEKTDTYNANADSTTQAFTNNANSKTEAYNTNATEKLGTYNSNHTAKLKEYNDNATSKLSAYNTNTVTKTTEYNSNHTNKINAYNTNASNKVDAYNTNADTRLEEYNTNADNKIAEYDEHSKELNNKIVSIGNDYRMVKDQLLYTGEDTDTFIHVEDSAMAEMKEIKVDGVCEQNTTKGNQLIDFASINSISCDAKFENDTLEITSNKSYSRASKNITELLQNNVGKVLNFTFKSIDFSKALSGRIQLNVSKNDGTHLYQGLVESSGKKVSYTIPNDFSDITSIVLEMYSNNTSENSDTELTILKPLLYFENNDTYEPYTGGQPSPSPDYPQEIKTITDSLKVTSCWKNLFDINKFKEKITGQGIASSIDGSSIICNGTATTTYATVAVPKLSNVKLYPGEHMISVRNTLPYPFAFQTARQDGTRGPDVVLHENMKSEKFKVNELLTIDSAFLSFMTARPTLTNFTISDIQIERANTASEYEPYVESQIQAKLPENEFIGKLDNTYKDTLRAEYFPEEGQYHWMLDKMIGHKNFNNETKILYSELQGDYFLFQITIGYLPSAVMISNNFINKSNYGLNYNYESIYRGSADNNAFQFKVKKERVASYDAAGALSFIKNSNTEAYYVLATPYTIDLGPIDMPLSYKGITNIFTDSDLLPTINAKYYRVFDKTIQNAQINEKTLKQEITDLNATVSALDTRLKALETKTVEEPTESEGTV